MGPPALLVLGSAAEVAAGIRAELDGDRATGEGTSGAAEGGAGAELAPLQLPSNATGANMLKEDLLRHAARSALETQVGKKKL